jgi:short-subunit dehydrogenase
MTTPSTTTTSTTTSTTYFLGGSKGIALDAAKRLVGRGQSVTLVARSGAGLESARAELAQCGTGDVETIESDLYNSTAVDALIAHR